MKHTWDVKKIEEETLLELSSALGVNRYIASILIAKGKDNLIDAYHFLNPKLSSLNSPFLMKGMDEAVMRIREALSKGEKIGIFADSDLDGLTSLTILLNLFEKIGNEPYCRYAVEDEDYGLRMEVIDELNENGIKLLITLDSGIRDINEIAYARKLGIDVIVCDHHEQGIEAPDSIIVNPKQVGCAYPFKELAGVGVAFKLCHGMLISYLQSFNKFFLLITRDSDEIYLYYIKNGITEKIDTASDVSQLSRLSNDIKEIDNIVFYDLGEDEELITNIFREKDIYDLNSLIGMYLGDGKHVKNYSINNLCDFFSIDKNVFKKRDIVNMVFSEIEYNHSPKIRQFINSTIDLVSVGTIADIMPIDGENRTIVHHGLKALNSTVHPGLSILVNKLKNEVTSKNIAWDISPLLNTPGRFGKTDLTAKFFLEKDAQILNSILGDINKLNNERKKLVSDLLSSMLTDIESGKIEAAGNLLWINSSETPEGLAGLLANRLSDSVGRPVIVVSLWGNKDIVKGSGRSTGDFNFFSFVEPHSVLFEKLGGHPKAFGFSARIDKLEDIRKQVEISIGANYQSNDKCHIDVELPIEVIDCDFINSLSLFEPHGHENEECVFLTRDARLKDFNRFGNGKNHGKYTFADNPSVEAIGWNMAPEMERYFEKKKLDILYRLENNIFNGRMSPRMLILDID